MPGRDYSPWVEYFGGGLLALTLAGVVLHGGARVVVRRRQRKGSN